MTIEPATLTYRTFTITGKVLSGSDSHAEHSVYWAIRNSEYDPDILITQITIGNGETK